MGYTKWSSHAILIYVHITKMVKMAISAVQQGDPGLHIYAFFF